MTTKTVQISGIPVQLTRKRVKNINLRVSREGRVDVSYPWHTSEAAAIAFVESKSDWIRTALSRASSLGEKNLQAPTSIASGHTVNVWGHPYNLRIVHGPKRTAHIFAHDVVITLPNRYLGDLASEVSQQAIRKTFDEFLAQEMRTVLPELTVAMETRAQKHASRYKIRRMKSRWGSCNIKTSTITLNLELAEHDKEALKYVIAHELTHLYVRGHNKEFYALLATFYPNWKEVRASLKGARPSLR
ncbi:SprT family zinc-dependent metalloprotease [Lancefieldella rimae]|uniref:M48 family metallopeptidase n=1 Tax=Lancefieldella rimae TaxID=1383 RepID=UPI0028EE2BF7|nr:SprT family zinc-dependent metalloprotease [Lancefieldella rimae]